MDWISIGVAALCGAAGGLIGWLAGTPIKQHNIRLIVTAAVVVAASQIGSKLITPYVEIEYLFANPSPQIQSLVRLAPNHVAELKARMIEAYESGGTDADFQRAGFLWARQYAVKNFTQVFASRDDNFATTSFDRYMAAFKTVFQHDRVVCYDWFEGIGTPTSQQLGWGPAELANLETLMDSVPKLSEAKYRPLPRSPLDPALQRQVLDNVKANWDAHQLDFDDLAKPTAALANDRKARACYTGFALLSEIQRLPLADRLRYLRSIYGA